MKKNLIGWWEFYFVSNLLEGATFLISLVLVTIIKCVFFLWCCPLFFLPFAFYIFILFPPPPFSLSQQSLVVHIHITLHGSKGTVKEGEFWPNNLLGIYLSDK
jgi:hypothetical protein